MKRRVIKTVKFVTCCAECPCSYIDDWVDRIRCEKLPDFLDKRQVNKNNSTYIHKDCPLEKEK